MRALAVLIVIVLMLVVWMWMQNHPAPLSIEYTPVGRLFYAPAPPAPPCTLVFNKYCAQCGENRAKVERVVVHTRYQFNENCMRCVENKMLLRRLTNGAEHMCGGSDQGCLCAGNEVM